MIEDPSADPSMVLQGPVIGVCAPCALTPVIAVPTRGTAWLFTTFHRLPLLITICSPLNPIAMPCAEVGVVLAARGNGGNKIEPVTCCWSRSTDCTLSPPVFATYNVDPTSPIAI